MKAEFKEGDVVLHVLSGARGRITKTAFDHGDGLIPAMVELDATGKHYPLKKTWKIITAWRTFKHWLKTSFTVNNVAAMSILIYTLCIIAITIKLITQ